MADPVSVLVTLVTRGPRRGLKWSAKAMATEELLVARVGRRPGWVASLRLVWVWLLAAGAEHTGESGLLGSHPDIVKIRYNGGVDVYTVQGSTSGRSLNGIGVALIAGPGLDADDTPAH